MFDLEELDKKRDLLIQQRGRINEKLRKYRPSEFLAEKQAIFEDKSVEDPFAEWQAVREEMNEEKDNLINERTQITDELIQINLKITRGVGAQSVGMLDEIPNFLRRPDGSVDFGRALVAILKEIATLSEGQRRIERVLSIEESLDEEE